MNSREFPIDPLKGCPFLSGNARAARPASLALEDGVADDKSETIEESMLVQEESEADDDDVHFSPFGLFS